jgi:predicted naringenin-chalcone synthase
MYLRAIASTKPTRSWTQPECWEALNGSRALETLKPRSRELLEKVLLGRNGIERRHFATERIGDVFSRQAQQLNESFEREASRLGATALRQALERADLGEVNALFVCSCTGYLCPGLSSHLAEALALPADTYLLDITGAGCGAALPAIQAACHYLQAHPTHRAAVVAVEICSSAFYINDDPGVLVSLCLFGDGAAALILDGPEVRRSNLRFQNFHTLHRPEHREKIRFVNRDGKLCNQLNRSVPELAADSVLSLFRQLNCDSYRIISHSGGRDVLEAIRSQIPGQDLEEAEAVLREGGNMSSPAVLMALEKNLRDGKLEPRWLTAFGAGFTCHSCTLEE